jgi:hypothetical protein
MYKILNTKNNGEILETEVEYTLGKETVTCFVSHFMPDSKETVISNIENRELTEQNKLDAFNKNEEIIAEIAPVMMKDCVNRLTVDKEIIGIEEKVV